MSKKIAIKDNCLITPGFAFKSKDFGSGKNIAIKIKDIQPPYINYKDADNVCVKPNDGNMQLKKGDFVMAMTGATIGKIGYLPDDVDNVFINQRVCKFTEKKGYDHKYLYYVFLQKSFQNFVINNIDSSSAQPNISHNTVGNFTHIFPDSEEYQRKVGTALSKIDNKINLNNKINIELEKLAKELYKYRFIQFEFPDENGKPYKSSGGKMIWNNELKREIPEGRSSGDVGNLFISQAGYAFKSSGWTKKGHPVLTIKAINDDGSINIQGATYIKQYNDSLKKYTVNNGNMIFAMSGNTIGKLGIVASSFRNILINQRVLIIKSETSNIAYTYFTLRDEKIQNLISQLGANSAQPNISEESLRNIKIAIPSYDLLNHYNQICSSYFKEIIHNRIENQELSELRDFLLPMLMNGQVTVK